MPRRTLRAWLHLGWTVLLTTRSGAEAGTGQAGQRFLQGDRPAHSAAVPNATRPGAALAATQRLLSEAEVAFDTEPGPIALLPMQPSCDHLNVGFPNCGEAARCEGEYHVDGTTRVLKSSSTDCAYVTFKTSLSLQQVMQLDADVFISADTCSQLDNLAFWFFQTASAGDALEEPASHWDALSEVDLMETYIGPGGINSVNTNFAATGIHRHWSEFTITGGVHQHVTMWQDPANRAGCPAVRTSGMLTGVDTVGYGKALPVVSVYVARCAPGAPCCSGDGCAELQGRPETASACITVKEAPLLFALSNWGAGHQVTPGCEIGVSEVKVRLK